MLPEDKDVFSDGHSASVSIQGCDVGTVPLFNPQPLFGLCSGPGLPSDHVSLLVPAPVSGAMCARHGSSVTFCVFFLTPESWWVACRKLSPWVCPGSLALRHGRTPLCPRWGGWMWASPVLRVWGHLLETCCFFLCEVTVSFFVINNI